MYCQVGDGAKNVSVGTLIAMLAEEGDDISNLQPPSESESKPAPKEKESSKSSSSSSEPSSSSSSSATTNPSSSASHSGHHELPKGPIFPSVMRLLAEHNVPVKDAKKIKGTGIRGMLTKGDVLAHLGLASSPTGTFKVQPPKDSPAKPDAPKKVCLSQAYNPCKSWNAYYSWLNRWSWTAQHLGGSSSREWYLEPTRRVLGLSLSRQHSIRSLRITYRPSRRASSCLCCHLLGRRNTDTLMGCCRSWSWSGQGAWIELDRASWCVWYGSELWLFYTFELVSSKLDFVYECETLFKI